RAGMPHPGLAVARALPPDRAAARGGVPAGGGAYRAGAGNAGAGASMSKRETGMTDDTHSRTQLPGLARAGANGAAPPALDPRRWLALVVILIAGVMDLLDVTIVNVAAPSILRDLHATYAQFEWVVSGYVLGFAALLITGGRLGGVFGRKRMFLLGGGGVVGAAGRRRGGGA